MVAVYTKDHPSDRYICSYVVYRNWIVIKIKREKGILFLIQLTLRLLCVQYSENSARWADVFFLRYIPIKSHEHISCYSFSGNEKVLLQTCFPHSSQLNKIVRHSTQPAIKIPTLRDISVLTRAVESAQTIWSNKIPTITTVLPVHLKRLLPPTSCIYSLITSSIAAQYRDFAMNELLLWPDQVLKRDFAVYKYR